MSKNIGSILNQIVFQAMSRVRTLYGSGNSLLFFSYW